MSSKLFVSASLISLALVSVGCNANLSTGHPNAKPVAANVTPPAGGATTPASKAVAPAAAAAGKVGVMDSDLSGTFACHKDSSSDRNEDACLSNETVAISDDLKTVTLSWTGNVGKTLTSCDQVQVITIDPSTATIGDDGTNTWNNTATVTGTFQPIVTTSTSSECKAALKALSPNAAGKNPITLQIAENQGANDEVYLTIPSETLALHFTRSSTSDDSSTSASTSSGAASTASGATGTSSAAASGATTTPAAPAAPATTVAAPADSAASPAQPAEVVNPLDDGKVED